MKGIALPSDQGCPFSNPPMRSRLHRTLLTCLGLLLPTAVVADTAPPNIVLILPDDQSYTDYGFMGHPHIETPHLDRLASESALFRHGYVPTALCRPALMTIATGLYSHDNRITGNDPDDTPENAAHADKAGQSAKELLISNVDRTGTVAKWLGEKGYVSHQSGKWWEGSYERGGFTAGMTRGYPDKGGRHGDDGLKIGREGMDPVFDFIDRSVADEKPFFVWYAPFLPHTPHDPPQELAAKYEAKGVHERIAKYYANIERLDDTVGLLMEKLDDAGVTEDTLVIYVTDNGWIQTETGTYAERSKRSPNEGGTRNPIMFRWPGTIPVADRPELCSSIDIVPTILAAAGTKGPHDFPGLNLLPELESGDPIDRDTLYGESFAHDIADIENPQASLLYRWVIKGNDKLLLTYDGAPGKMKYPPQGGAAQLYDLEKDPNETVNLAADQPEKVEALSALLDQWYVADQRQVGKVTEVAPKRQGRAKGQPKGKGEGTADQKQSTASDGHPDVVFIIVDDLNDYLGYLDGHPNAVSPHIDALAESGMAFTQAYCNSPQCRPSRTSLNYGKYASNTGTYFNAKFKEETRIETPTMQQFFMGNGYRVASGGKVFHGNPGTHGDSLFKKPGDPKPPKGENKFNAYGSPADGYALDATDEEMSDYKVASWAIDEWNAETDKPLFMSVGFFRPHRPLQVPAPWFDKFPIDSIQRPAEPAEGDDWDDIPEFARKLARSHAHKNMINGLSDHEDIVKRELWDETLQAYLASVAFVDAQIGRFLEALESNPRGRDTVVILTSDHGWHLGEKKHWCKGAIWEQTLKVPFIVRAPGVEAGTVSTQPVSLIDVYPSLVDLAGLEVPTFLDGQSIKPQLEDPKAPRDPAVSFYGEANTSIRSNDWRYIRYEDGSEELYHHRDDPNEWVNEADNPDHARIKKRLSRFIPANPHPGLKVQDWFDQYQP
jgi:uncharacterized sulfatase